MFIVFVFIFVCQRYGIQQVFRASFHAFLDLGFLQLPQKEVCCACYTWSGDCLICFLFVCLFDCADGSVQPHCLQSGFQQNSPECTVGCIIFGMRFLQHVPLWLLNLSSPKRDQFLWFLSVFILSKECGTGFGRQQFREEVGKIVEKDIFPETSLFWFLFAW